MKLRAAVGAGILLMCLLAITCTRQTPGNPSSNQAQPNNAATTPPTPAPAPTAVEEKKPAAPPAPAAPAVVEKATPTPAPPVVLPAGTVLTVRTSEAIGTKQSQPGQAFQAVLAEAVTHGSHAVIPAGSTVTGKIVEAKQGGKIKGGSNLALQLTSIKVHGLAYPISTDQYVQEAKGKGKRTATMGGGGAAAGAVIGGIAGGGKGAAIGALAGGGAGVAGSAFTGNKELSIPAESVLQFKLAQSLRLNPPASRPANEPNQ
jgi:hypothetical protein